MFATPDTPPNTPRFAILPTPGRTTQHDQGATTTSDSRQASLFGKSVSTSTRTAPSYTLPRSGRASRDDIHMDLRNRLMRRHSPYNRHCNLNSETHPERVRENVSFGLRRSEQMVSRLLQKNKNLASTYSAYPDNTRRLLQQLTKWRATLYDHQQLLIQGKSYQPRHPSKKNTLASNRLKQEWMINAGVDYLQTACQKFINIQPPRSQRRTSLLLGDEKKIEMIERQIGLVDRLQALISSLSGQKIPYMSATTTQRHSSPLRSQPQDETQAQSRRQPTQLRAQVEILGNGWQFHAAYREQSAGDFSQFDSVNSFFQNFRQRAHSDPQGSTSNLFAVSDMDQISVRPHPEADRLNQVQDEELSMNLNRLALKES